jgi:hypothetical protein
MGFWDDLFGASDQPYPTKHTGPVPPGCGGPYQPGERGGFFNRVFAPKQLAYPTPPCYTGKIDTCGSGITTKAVVPALAAAPNAGPSAAAIPAVAPASVPAASVAVAPAAAAAPAPVNGATPSNGASAAPASTLTPAFVGTSVAPTANVADPIAVGECYPLPTAKILRAYVYNPDMTSCIRTAQEELIAEQLGEDIGDDLAAMLSSKMISRDGTPVAFVVPAGCDSVDFLCSPIEVNPGCGCDGDLDHCITVGTAKLSANVCDIDGPLTPGDQIIVTVPWRAASWVDLPANRLRVQLLASFYRAEQSLNQ